MARLLKRESAKRDLIGQWVWYAENAGLETAENFLSAAHSTLSLLSHQPESGIRTILIPPELQGMRRFPIGDGFEKIFLFYFPLEDGIDLIRVIHANRDLKRLLTEGFSG